MLYGSGTDPKDDQCRWRVPTQADLDVGTIAAIQTLSNSAISYALNDIAACLNGGTVGSGSRAGPADTDAIAHRRGGRRNILNGHVRRITFYSSRRATPSSQALTA